MKPFSFDTIHPGESAVVKTVGGKSAMRQRWLDLGLIPGTKVTCVGQSPAGDPKAYLIRGAIIAIRKQDGQHIWMEKEDPANAVVS